MAVNTPQIEINPYTSTVPLVQIPMEQIGNNQPSGPLPGRFDRKSTGPMAIGDALFKGFMKGHEVKEQRKNTQAQATIAAADSATEAAYQKYQDALSTSGGKVDDPGAKAAYEAYLGVFNQAKETKAKFVLPEKPQKGQKKEGGKDGQKKLGFGGIKDFFAANPHIVPQIALMAMQPKPQGLTPRGQIEQLQLNDARRQDAEAQQKINDRNIIATYGKLTEQEINALPPEEKAKVTDKNNGLAAAKARWNMDNPARGKYDTYVDQQGNYHSIPEGTTDIPEGWRPYAKPTGSAPKGEEAFVAEYAQQHGIDLQNMPAATRKYLHDVWQYRNPQTTTTSSAPAHLDAQGNQVPGSTSSTRGSAEPKPPAGVAAVDAEAPQGGTQRLPSAQSGPLKAPPVKAKSASGKITSPPTAKGKGTWQQTQNTERVETEKKDRYAKASAKYQKAIADSWKLPDAASQKEAAALAKSNYDAEVGEIEKWYASQVHAVGGTMPGESTKKQPTPPPGATMMYKDKDGNIKGYAVNGQYVPVGQ